MSNLSAVYQPKEDVRYRVVANEAVVVRQQSAEVVVLNEVAARILQLLDARTPVSGLIQALKTEFDVNPDQLEQDVLGFIEELLNAGVIMPTVSNVPESDDEL